MLLRRCPSMTTPFEALTGQDGGVYTLHITREEGLAILRALGDWAGHTPESVRVMSRLAARLSHDVQTKP
ncbi:hypothetical protein [Streptomyces sp. NPDC001933]|uniref:hypothetical protein n=1 Tax=Streptomyces sp. NPDC001933 TaxID=3364626 RepID=UPI0036932ECA